MEFLSLNGRCNTLSSLHCSIGQIAYKSNRVLDTEKCEIGEFSVVVYRFVYVYVCLFGRMSNSICATWREGQAAGQEHHSPQNEQTRERFCDKSHRFAILSASVKARLRQNTLDRVVFQSRRHHHRRRCCCCYSFLFCSLSHCAFLCSNARTTICLHRCLFISVQEHRAVWSERESTSAHRLNWMLSVNNMFHKMLLLNMANNIFFLVGNPFHRTRAHKQQQQQIFCRCSISNTESCSTLAL